jgi:hypothetical protein
MNASPFALASGKRTRLLCYRAETDEWLIAWPCERCGGMELPLVARPEDVDTAGACPGCHAREKHAETSNRPDVWWDPQASDWVVRIPCGPAASAVLPLEIPWYDAPRALIHCAAADLVYLGDALCEL